MSSFSNYNTNNIKSVTLAPFFLALFLKIHSILKFLIRGVLLPKLIRWLISLIPLIRSSVFKRLAYYFKLVAIILLLSEIMPAYLHYTKKGLVCIIIIALFSCQLSSYAKCIKSNICSFCNIHLMSNAKCTFLIYFYTF